MEYSGMCQDGKKYECTCFIVNIWTILCFLNVKFFSGTKKQLTTCHVIRFINHYFYFEQISLTICLHTNLFFCSALWVLCAYILCIILVFTRFFEKWPIYQLNINLLLYPSLICILNLCYCPFVMTCPLLRSIWLLGWHGLSFLQALHGKSMGQMRIRLSSSVTVEGGVVGVLTHLRISA